MSLPKDFRTKTKTMSWVRYVIFIGQVIYADEILTSEPQGKEPLQA